MKRRRWNSEGQTRVVLEYLKTQKMTEIRTKYSIHLNHKGNTDTEMVLQTLKEGLI